MTPFGWRFMGALMGVLMLPVMYLLVEAARQRTDKAFVHRDVLNGGRFHALHADAHRDDRFLCGILDHADVFLHVPIFPDALDEADAISRNR